MKRISQRVNGISRPPLVEVREELRRMREAGHLTADFLQAAVNVKPWSRLDAQVEATSGSVRFRNALTDPTSGLLSLKERIAAHRQSACRQRIAEQNVLVTAGANHASLMAALALWNVNEEIIVPTPYFFNLVSNLQLASLLPVYVPASGANHFKLHIDEIESGWTARTKGVALVNPSNPTGVSLTEADTDRLQQLMQKRAGTLLVDESYFDFLPPEEKPRNLWDLETTVLLGSFSKSHALIGHRVGYMIASEEIIEAAKKVLDCTMIAASTVGQHAALAALEDPRILAGISAAAEERRTALREALEPFGDIFTEVHFGCPVFAFIGVNPRIGAGMLCEKLLQRGVGIGRGEWFGEKYSDYVRICCCNPSAEEFDVGLRTIVDCCTDFLLC